MAKNIHPETRKVKYKFSHGRSLEIESVYDRSPEFLLEIDIFNHHAWREDEKNVNTGSAKVSKFNDTFGGLSPLGTLKAVVLDKKDNEV